MLARRDRAAPVVAIVTWVKAGYFDEPDDVGGIAHVLEHMYFKGTPRFAAGEIATATKACGGILNAATIYDHTAYYAVVPAERFVDALDIQFDAFAHSVLDADELRRELDVIIQEAARKRDTPSAVAIETLYEVLHDVHRMRRWRIGHDDVLRRLTRDELERFYRTYYVPSNTIVSVVGDLDETVMLDAVAERYGTLVDAPIVRDRGPREDQPPSRRWREWSGDLQQAELAIGWRTVPPQHPDAVALDLASVILGSGRSARLHQALRETGLAAAASASHYAPTECGVLLLHARAPQTSAADALDALWAQLARLSREGPSDVELDRARRLLAVRRLRRLESMDGQAMEAAAWEALDDPTGGEAWYAAVARCTAADVCEALRRWCAPTAASVVVYRPHTMSPVADATGTGFARLDRATAAALPPMRTPTFAPPRAGRAEHERIHRGATGDVHLFRTRAGVPLLVRRQPGTPLVHLGAYAAGGAVEETAAAAGVTQLTTRVMTKGAGSRDALALATDAEWLGGAVHASVGAESFGFSISVPTDALADAAGLLADVVLAPTFPVEAIETERLQARAEVAQLRDDMARWPMRLGLDAAWAGHPYGISASGSDASLAALSREALREWHDARIARAPGVLLVVGDVDPATAAAALAAAFDRWALRSAPVTPAAPWPAVATQQVDARDKRQTGLAMLFPGPDRHSPERVVAEVVTVIAGGLGGRFFESLRSRQSLAYSVQVLAGERRAGGYLGGYLAMAPSREAEARAGLLREWQRLRDAPVTGEELARAVTYLAGVRAIRRQSGGALLGELLDAWLAGSLDEIDAWDAAVRRVTSTDCAALVERWIDPSRAVEGIVRGVG